MCRRPGLWNAATGKVCRIAWSSAPDDTQLKEWLTQFLEPGFIVFTGVPTKPESIFRVGSSFGFTRETNFGALFDVRSTAAASDLAYTSLPLDPHTDNPYRDPVPGVQLLHCLVNETSGGLSTLVDGFAAAQALKERDGEAFKLLSSTPVRFRYQDPTTELVASATPIQLDAAGGVVTIHFSPRLDFVPLRPPKELADYYRARRAFDHLLRSPEFEIRFLLGAGELLMMDNRRLLHGRTGFDPGEGERHLQGCYIDIDGPRSLYRVVRRRLSRTTHMNKIVSFRGMEDGTREDYLLLDQSERDYAIGLADRVMAALRRLDHSLEGYPRQPPRTLTAGRDARGLKTTRTTRWWWPR